MNENTAAQPGVSVAPEIPAFEDAKTVQLRKPVEFNGTTYDHLDLSEPTAKQMEDASKAGGDVAVGIALISLVAKVPRRVVELLCLRDFQECSGFFDRFGSGSRETGGTSSPN